ncbi:TPA: hypothetical protein N0F65_000142 [Lagenidium giganteum]|uniref:CCHC-type domain-containing protein n=1 Tax=Lagenidium giganteum TaxID=4803 RepID=A0AAV2YHC9_9STRA|nr:TPA: hypothetical protein N0F65_000142 [Lagenidium giganteum]
MATFMKCLRDGPTKAQLFRVFSSTLEGAIALAQQEDFSSPQARAHASRASARHEPEPKDICMVHARARSNSDAPVEHRVHFARGGPRRDKCQRCGSEGHFAAQSRVWNSVGDLRPRRNDYLDGK